MLGSVQVCEIVIFSLVSSASIFLGAKKQPRFGRVGSEPSDGVNSCAVRLSMVYLTVVFRHWAGFYFT